MKILLRTDSTNPDYYADCECAVLDMTPELLARITTRVEILRKAAEADIDVCKIVFWGCGPEFYSYKLIDACAEVAEPGASSYFDWEDQFQEAGVLPLPNAVDLGRFEPQRTECDQEIIRVRRIGDRLDFEAAWMMIPKHSNIHIATEVLTLDCLEDFAESEAAAS